MSEIFLLGFLKLKLIHFKLNISNISQMSQKVK